MRRSTTAAAVALALLLVAPPPARAYSFTCRGFANAVLSGDDSLVSAAAGHSLGVTDMMAGLLCFARDRRCLCASNVAVNRTSLFSEAVASGIIDCAARSATDPAFGAIFNAVLELCR